METPKGWQILVVGRYTQEQAGALVKDWTQLKERLAKRLRGLEKAIDLDSGVREMDPRLKSRVKKLIREGYEPSKVNDKYPEPAALLVLVARLRDEGKTREAAYLSRAIRDIRLLRSLAFKMSGRRARKETLVRVDKRLAGVCWSCHRTIQEGEMVWWDRDRGVVWHEICGDT